MYCRYIDGLRKNLRDPQKVAFKVVLLMKVFSDNERGLLLEALPSYFKEEDEH